MTRATDLEQIEVFRRLHRQIGAQLQAVEQTAAQRDVNIATLDFAELTGQEVQNIKTPAECDQNIVLLLQSMRRNAVRAIDDLKDIKGRASHTNGVAHIEQPLPHEKREVAPVQPSFDEEDMEVVEE